MATETTRRAFPAGRGPGATAALTLILATLSVAASPGAIQAQSPEAGWLFEGDDLTELWFHTLAIIGFDGFGVEPLYNRGYAADHAGSFERSALASTRDDLLAALEADPAFEVLHFVPLYFHRATREVAMDAVRAVAGHDSGVPRSPPEAREGTEILATLLPTRHQRQILGSLVEVMDEEWFREVGPRLEREREMRADRSVELNETWRLEWVPRLGDFLDRGGHPAGEVTVTSTVGNDGRILTGVPGRTLVVVGGALGDPVPAILGALVRELCYPAVRRVTAPFEGRLQDRVDASVVSDLAATRCGELLLDGRLPEHVAAYRSRFRLPDGRAEGTFLSAAGIPPGAAALGPELDRALRRELNLDPDVRRARSHDVGRNR